ncbi:unnamed protein product [Amoebophrya sp. A120]|nr:unnamed protein product [Amoebophrya sp. A120]|eukprot:GSA120T00021544001.1
MGAYSQASRSARVVLSRGDSAATTNVLTSASASGVVRNKELLPMGDDGEDEHPKQLYSDSSNAAGVTSRSRSVSNASHVSVNYAARSFSTARPTTGQNLALEAGREEMRVLRQAANDLAVTDPSASASEFSGR